MARAPKSETKKATTKSAKSKPKKSNDASPEELLEFYRKMLLIRRFEEKAGQLYGMGLIGGFCHLYIGQEAVVVGMKAASKKQDTVITSYRDHGHMIAYDMDPKGVMAELTGRRGGYSKGKGGSMHICDLELNMLGANGIVGAGAPIAVGAAFANKYRGNDTVAVVFFGDGATNIGAFHEAANMAAALQLPAVFVCENNEYGEYTPRHKTMAIDDVVDRAAGYGMPGVIVDGMDAVAVYEAATQAVARARAGHGPSFIEAKTYRYYNHHGVQIMGFKYRTDEEVDSWKARDCIDAMERDLVAQAVMTQDEIDAIRAEVQQAVDEAVEFGRDSPYPELDEMLTDVYTIAAN